MGSNAQGARAEDSEALRLSSHRLHKSLLPEPLAVPLISEAPPSTRAPSCPPPIHSVEGQNCGTFSFSKTDVFGMSAEV